MACDRGFYLADDGHLGIRTGIRSDLVLLLCRRSLERRSWFSVQRVVRRFKLINTNVIMVLE